MTRDAQVSRPPHLSVMRSSGSVDRAVTNANAENKCLIVKCRQVKVMELSEALKIIRILSDGIDPETGEVLEDESVFNKPQVIRALAVAANALERVHKIESRKGMLPDNAGKAWATEEDSELIEAFEKGESISELAIKHSSVTSSPHIDPLL